MDPNVDDDIVKMVIKNIKFKYIQEFDSFDNVNINRLINYKRGDYKCEINYLHKAVYFSHQFDTNMMKLFSLLFQNINYQKKIFPLIEFEILCRLWCKTDIIPKDSYIINDIKRFSAAIEVKNNFENYFLDKYQINIDKYINSNITHKYI